MTIKKIIRKIFITTLCLFIVLVVGTITNFSNQLKVNVELEDITNITNTNIYLLNKDGYLVRKGIFVDEEDTISSIKKVINYLKISSNSKYSSSLSGLIPSSVSINNILYDEGYITIDFSNDFLNCPDLELCITSIIYSLFDLDGVDGITILVDDKYLEGYPRIITKDLDINKESFITSRDDISKVIVYYLSLDEDEVYYVPVTKYLNDSREKINIIVDQMKSSSTYDLVSLVNSNVELISSREDNDMMILNFNSYLFDNNDEVLEEVLYCLSYSVFDNYDVSAVMIEVNGRNIREIYRDNVEK